MASHLAHEIPWDSLCELYLLASRPLQSPTHYVSQANRIQHAAHCFAHALYESQQHDTTSENDRAFYDPANWDKCVFADGDGGEPMAFEDSLVWGYIELNLILADPKKIVPQMMPDGRPTRALRVLIGAASGAHPAEFAVHLRKAFDGERLRPLTRHVLQILYDHASLLFRCMWTGARGHELDFYKRLATMQFFQFFGYPPPDNDL